MGQLGGAQRSLLILCGPHFQHQIGTKMGQDTVYQFRSLASESSYNASAERDDYAHAYLEASPAFTLLPGA